jgi:hypothetical protein
VENLLNQARKYKVGLILAHQNLEQFDQRLRATVMASTSIKLVGGLSAWGRGVRQGDALRARVPAGDAEETDRTEFACFIRNVTAQPVRLSVPFGRMEARPRMGEAELEEVFARNRFRLCTVSEDGSVPGSWIGPRQSASGFALGEQEVL